MPKKQSNPPYSGPVDGVLLVQQMSSSDKKSPLYLFTEDESFSLHIALDKTLEQAGVTIVHDVSPKLNGDDLVSNLLLADGRVIRLRDHTFLVNRAQQKRRELPSYKELPYPVSPKRTEQDDGAPYFHLYLRQALERLPNYQGVTRIQSGEPRRHKDNPLRGFIDITTTHNDGSVHRWFTKRFSSRASFEAEEENNRVLSIWQSHRNITTLLTATFHFRGRFVEGEPHEYFLVFKHVDHVKINEVSKQKEFTDVHIGRGLVELLEVFVRTSPIGAGLQPDMSVIRFWHKDLHEGQVIFDITTKQCHLVDFGNSHLEYIEGRKRSIIGSSSSTPADAEHAKTVQMFAAALHERFSESPITAEVKALKTRIKGRLCNLVDLKNLQSLVNQ